MWWVTDRWRGKRWVLLWRGSTKERRQGCCWGGHKEGNCRILYVCSFTLQHENPSSHWSAHCSLHHDKGTPELPPSRTPTLLSPGSSSVVAPYGPLHALPTICWPTSNESLLLSWKEMSQCCKGCYKSTSLHLINDQNCVKIIYRQDGAETTFDNEFRFTQHKSKEWLKTIKSMINNYSPSQKPHRAGIAKKTIIL